MFIHGFLIEMLEFSQFQNNTALISFERGCEKNVVDVEMKKEAASGECSGAETANGAKGFILTRQ